ncbi:MAG: HlyD family efflux transporter periplasmic adaptor subunit [Ilumatobacteraceae bacterium]|nr:HlyD family efflux transporter periplasmic adaptor subunit [Ilumatobacteraceae bacterium]
MNKPKAISSIAVIAVVVAAVFVGKSLGGSSTGSSTGLLIVPRQVERRSLEDVLTVSGEIRRDETKKINSPVDGQVSDVAVSDGDTINAGDTIFSLDGRDSVAVKGKFAFYRPLDVGDIGPDVRQLEDVLIAAGTGLKKSDELYTEETRTALGKWQIKHAYPAAVASSEKTITVSLGQNQAGYSIGKYNSIAYVISPLAKATSIGTGPGSARRFPRVAPTISIAVDRTSVLEGGTVVFTVTASAAPVADLTVNINVAGSSTGGVSAVKNNADYGTINNTVVIAAGTTTATITRQIFTDSVIEDEEDLQISIQQQSFGGTNEAYTLGSTSAARVVIPANGSDLIRTLTIEASTDKVAEGRSVTMTVKTTVKSNQALDFYVATKGVAESGTDYVKINQDDLQIGANNTTVTFTIDARADDVVETDESFTVSLVADPNYSTAAQPYVVGAPSSATITIDSGDLPELSLVGGGIVKKGSSATFVISADEAVSADTSVTYQLSGSGRAGDDYGVLSGVTVLKKGKKSVKVTIETLNNGVIFKPSDMLVANWPSRIGTLNVKAGEFVLLGKTLFNLTEPVFTVVMSVSPTDRAKLSPGMIVKVNFNAGESILDGKISELDESPTVDAQGNSTYEGKVLVESDLESVDGAKVSIDVILEKKDNVLAVPVAAVLRASDTDEVRVVNDKGTISRVKVKIGLIDGEWAEIVEGLTGNELVVIDVDPAADKPNSVTQNT